jgi:hypothetical protein
MENVVNDITQRDIFEFHVSKRSYCLSYLLFITSKKLKIMCQVFSIV